MGDQQGGTGVVRKVITNAGQPGGMEPGRTALPGGDTRGFDLPPATLLEQLRLIKRIDELWDARVANGQLAYDEADHLEIQGYYRDWLAIAEVVAAGWKSRPAPDTPLRDDREFVDQLEVVRGICTPDEDFFAGPQLVELRDRAVRDFHAGETVEMRDMGD